MLPFLTFSDLFFLNENYYIFIKILLKFVLIDLSHITSCNSCTVKQLNKPLAEPMLTTNICYHMMPPGYSELTCHSLSFLWPSFVIDPQADTPKLTISRLFNDLIGYFEIGINSLWPGGTIWWRKSGLTFPHLMACCQVTSSIHLRAVSHEMLKIYLFWYEFENFTDLRLQLHLPGANELKGQYMCCCYPLSEQAWNELTHCGLVTPYGDINLWQHWLRQWLAAWRHQAIAWTFNVDL